MKYGCGLLTSGACQFFIWLFHCHWSDFLFPHRNPQYDARFHIVCTCYIRIINFIINLLIEKWPYTSPLKAWILWLTLLHGKWLRSGESGWNGVVKNCACVWNIFTYMWNTGRTDLLLWLLINSIIDWFLQVLEGSEFARNNLKYN